MIFTIFILIITIGFGVIFFKLGYGEYIRYRKLKKIDASADKLYTSEHLYFFLFSCFAICLVLVLFVINSFDSLAF